MIHELVKIDLLIIELRRATESGLGFIQQIRQDLFLKNLPVLVYSQVNDPKAIHQALELGVLNFLIKPYQDETIFQEVAKAVKIPWRAMHFEEERSFCAQMGFQPEILRKQREDLVVMADALARDFGVADLPAKKDAAMTQLNQVVESAESVGIWAVVEAARALLEKAEGNDWIAFKKNLAGLEFALKLVFDHLNPNHVPPGLLSVHERQTKEEEQALAAWMQADVDRQGPVVEWEAVKLQLDQLTNCPVVDSVAANFQMAASQKSGNMGNLMDLVSKDPGLAAQVLIAANQLHAVEDPYLAVTQLGDLKINTLANGLPTIEERRFFCPPLSWAHYWKFQVGVARLAQYACKYLEFFEMSHRAYTAGLLHDLGKLLLVKLYPHGFQAMLAYSRRRKVPLTEAERKFIGCTTGEIGGYFAGKSGLPQIYRNVIQWVETPEKATEDEELVAVISLARFLCMHNHVGICGDLPKDICPPIEDTAAWQVLQGKLFLSFNLSRFEAQIQAYCQQLRYELMGKGQ
jgi:HD-like signal output (HDOD) protein